MNNLALPCPIVRVEEARGGTCRGGVLITEERAGLGASPGVELQLALALLEGLYSLGRQERHS